VTERVIVEIVCCTCEDKWPTMAELIETKDGVVFRPRPYKHAAVEVHYRDGVGVTGARTRRRQHRDEDSAVDDETARFRCGCPNGHGVVSLERDMLTRAVDGYKVGGFQTVAVKIDRQTTSYFDLK
jgi:hypothetical protein